MMKFCNLLAYILGVKENDVCLVDLLLNEIRQGTSLKTRKMPRSVATISWTLYDLL